MVEPLGDLSFTSHAWDDSLQSTLAAGILNHDPEGDGGPLNAAGHLSRTLYNPFSYFRVRDLGAGLLAGRDYARLMVGHVLERLFGQGRCVFR